jgi:hypothetical protein
MIMMKLVNQGVEMTKSSQFSAKTYKDNSPTVKVGNHGLTTFTFSQPLTFEKTKTIPLWKLGDLAERQAYSCYLGYNSEVHFGYLMDLATQFTPDGVIDVLNTDGVYLCKSKYTKLYNKTSTWIDLGKTSNITLTLSESEPSLFKSRVTTVTFESKLKVDTIISMSTYSKLYVNPTENIEVNNSVMSWEWTLHPGTNTFKLVKA